MYSSPLYSGPRAAARSRVKLDWNTASCTYGVSFFFAHWYAISSWSRLGLNSLPLILIENPLDSYSGGNMMPLCRSVFHRFSFLLLLLVFFFLLPAIVKPESD